MTASVKCPHCGAHDLVHHFWQSVCTSCAKWSGVEPPQPAEVPDNTDRLTDVSTPVWDGSEPATPSSLISGARHPAQSTTPPEYVRPEPVAVAAAPEPVEAPVVPEPPAAPTETPVAE